MRLNKLMAFRMLHWLLRPMLPENDSQQLFLIRIFFASVLVHLIFLSFLFLYKWQKNVVHISSSSKLLSQAAVVYVPWVKRFNQLDRAEGFASTATGVQKKVANQSSTFCDHTQSKSRAGFVDIKRNGRAKKVLEIKTKSKKQKERLSKKKKSKFLSKNSKDKNLKKEKKNKLNEQIKKDEIKKEPKPLPIEEQKSLPVVPVPVEQNQQSIEQNIKESPKGEDLSVAPPSNLIISDNQVSEISAGVLTQPIYIGRDEKDEYEFISSLQEEIKSEWKPPLGFVWSKPCIVQISVDSDGKVQKVDIKQSSGILVVDISIRAAMGRITFSSSYVRAKELTLSFDC